MNTHTLIDLYAGAARSSFERVCSDASSRALANRWIDAYANTAKLFTDTAEAAASTAWSYASK